MDRRRLDATAYTVGWICALPVELAAAQLMLDEEHQPYDGVDATQYTLGRIGSHNVVLACLPAGQMGIGSAAFSAGQAMSRFTSIRFGVMVGVGGGVPGAEADVRLGDVVVSQPVRQYSGVVQYDFGKTGRGGQTTRTGSLDAPPKVLLHAVAQLRAHYYQDRASLATHLLTFDKHPRFSRARAGPDVLFEATYHHNSGPTCEQCSKDNVVHRTAREADEEVTIHYGTIASGNQVIKDGVTRDRLSEELGGVLCFEMEAAGLMNDFPCLVVRGICDYADSHKNKAWQPYAAATAASCAKTILSFVPVVEVAETKAKTVGDACKYRIPFHLKGVPVGKFAERSRDTQALRQVLLPQEKEQRGRRLLVVYGLGGMGKTQLAANFAQQHQHSFSSVLWLDGSSESSLKQSFAAFASRIPAGQIPEPSRLYATSQGGDIDTVIGDVLDWLSIVDNSEWLMVVDNVDRDDRRREEDAEAYAVEKYFPGADDGSVLITTRLPHLGQLGEQWEVKKVDKEQARTIFETWYGRGVGQEGDKLLGLLDGLPLALAQAAAYMSEQGASFSTYTRLYVEQWQELMKPHNGKHMPLRSYANGSVATTWTISYTAVRASNEGAANLLLLWAHLDNKGLWYGLLTIASRQTYVVANRTLTWLGEMARSEMEFVKAVGLLRNYSLIEEMEDQMGYAMHPVVHQWALSIQDDDQRTTLSWLAIVLVGIAVPLNDEAKYWETQAQLFPHAERCKERAVAMKERSEEQGFKEDLENMATLMWGIHGLGILYVEQGKLDEAEKMYLLALEGYTKVLGPEDISTLETLGNLGNLYKDQGRLDEAENTLVRALKGCENVLGVEYISTLRSSNNLGNVYGAQGKLDEAEKMYVRALEGYEKTLGAGHTYTLGTVGNLGSIYRDQGRLDEAEKMFMRVLEGFADATEQEGITISLPAIDSMWGLAVLFNRQNRVEEARLWYTKALAGYEQVYGENHTYCHDLRSNLAGLDRREGAGVAGVESGLANPENSPLQTVADVHVHEEPMAPKRRHKWKRLGIFKRGADRSK